jgi:tetratricopeptide (TPR) repeat protein
MSSRWGVFRANLVSVRAQSTGTKDAIMPRNRTTRLTFLLAAFATLNCAGLLIGCESPTTGERVRDVPLSEELRPAIEASRRSLREGDGGDPWVREDLDRYYELEAMLSTEDQRAEAEDSLCAYWSRDLRSVLWPEAAALYRHRLSDFESLQATFDTPQFPDSSTALGAYLREWRRLGPPSDGSGYIRAREARAELSPFDSVWSTLRLARFLRLQGRSDELLSLLIETLPMARMVGGWRLELETWRQIELALETTDNLDDALHAAAIAEDLANAVGSRTGNAHLEISTRLERAEVLVRRREVVPALALYESCAVDAGQAGLVLLSGRALNGAGRATDAFGRLEDGLAIYRRALAGALADGDSLNVPRHLANIARRHRILGDLDSCRFYLAEAERWIDAYPDPANRGRFPLMQAEYYAQVGDFAAVDSLLELAATLTPKFSPIDVLAELHIELIRQGTECGRPAQAYRSIAFLDSLRSRLRGSFADRNEVFDLDLAVADFLGRQGLFHRAAEAIDRAKVALEHRPDPGRRWELSAARAHLARRREDPELAESDFRECLALAEELGDEERLARSHLWLAWHEMERDRLDEARNVLSSGPATRFESRFRTRLSVALLRAAVDSRRGEFELALQTLTRAHELCRPQSPPDLMARLELESGRALTGLERYDEACDAFARARALLESVSPSVGSGEEIFLDRDIRRDLAEAILESAWKHSPDNLDPKSAEALLREVRTLVPAWRDEPAGSHSLADPQLIFFVGARSSYRWEVENGRVGLRQLVGARALIAAMAPVLADLRVPSRSPVTAEVEALTETLGGPLSRPGTTLTIVPDGPGFSVPWAALASPRGNWIDEGPLRISDAPAPRPAEITPRRPDEMHLIALGVDRSAHTRLSGLRDLRNAEREARQVVQRWAPARASLLVGESTEPSARFLNQLAHYDVIHISSHAQAYQGFEDQTTLFLGGVHDAPLTAAEIRDVVLDAELIFLSCCEAIGGVRRGVGAAHTSLARSFLDAGARHVIASGIPIDDAAARHLSSRFYEHWLKGASIEGALQMAQLDLRDGAEGWAHPYYWAFYQTAARPAVGLNHRHREGEAAPDTPPNPKSDPPGTKHDTD